MTEYYCILKDKFQNSNAVIAMYWKFTDYSTLWDLAGDLTEDKIVECFRAMIPGNLEYSGKYEVLSFDPKNGHLPDIPKKLVILETDNGLSTVGPTWISGDPIDMFKQQPSNYFKLRNETTDHIKG